MTDTGHTVNADRAVDVLLHALTELSDVLAAEREALADSGADIDAIGLRKRAAVLAVEEADRVRRGSVHPTGGERWDDVLALTERCRHQNLTNGAMLALRKRHADRLFALLRGDDEPSTYGASGFVTGPSATGRSRISA